MGKRNKNKEPFRVQPIEFRVEDLVIDEVKGKLVSFTFYNFVFKEVVVGNCFIYPVVNNMVISILPSETKDDVKAYIITLFLLLEKAGLKGKPTPTERILIFKNEHSYLVLVVDENLQPDMLEKCVKEFDGRSLKTDFFFISNSKYHLVEVSSSSIN